MRRIVRPSARRDRPRRDLGSEAREAAANAGSPSIIAREYFQAGQDQEADYRRDLTENQRRHREVRSAIGRLGIAWAGLVRPWLIDAHVVVAPADHRPVGPKQTRVMSSAWTWPRENSRIS
jgi:hypothetical protein